MNVTEITTAAGWITGLAIVALIATGWRKPARAAVNSARARRSPLAGGEQSLTETKELKTPFVAVLPWWRRAWAVIASGALAVMLGAVAATVIAFGTAWIVVTLTDILKQ